MDLKLGAIDGKQAQSFAAWMVILNFALLAAMPAAILAEAPPAASGSEPAPFLAGTDLCVQRCQAEASSCAGDSAEKGQTDINAACYDRIKSCYAECQLAPHLGLTAETAKDRHKKTQTSATSTEELRKKAKELSLAKGRIGEFLRNLGRMKLRIAKDKKIGLQPPAGMEDALAQGAALIDKLKSATDTASLGDTQSQMEAVAKTLKDDLALMQMQFVALKRFSYLSHMLITLDRQSASAQRLASEDPALADKAVAFGTAIDALKVAVQQAKDAINSGDVTGGYAILNTQIPDLMKAVIQTRAELMQAKAASTSAP